MILPISLLLICTNYYLFNFEKIFAYAIKYTYFFMENGYGSST